MLPFFLILISQPFKFSIMSSTDKKITLSEAQSWTQQWRNDESTYNAHNECNAFLIPVQDLNGVLSEMGNPDDDSDACIRAYLGVDPSDNTEKLIIVGTEKDRSGVYRDLLPTSDTDTRYSIWDFTQPCPPICDPTSALN
tara:strand:+ start:22961 stop:23380 length:420 start_codon:yes stop_codon:yes gene_type:complete